MGVLVKITYDTFSNIFNNSDTKILCDYIKAEKYYFDAYKLNDSIHNEIGLAKSMYNMGWILCLQQGQTDKAYYFFNALKIYENNDDRKVRLLVYDALGNDMGNYQTG